MTLTERTGTLSFRAMKQLIATRVLCILGLGLTLGACGPTVRVSSTGHFPSKPNGCPVKYGFVSDTSAFDQVGYVQLEHIEGDPFSPQNMSTVAPYACDLGGEYVGLLGTMSSWSNGNGANYIILIPKH